MYMKAEQGWHMIAPLCHHYSGFIWGIFVCLLFDTATHTKHECAHCVRGKLDQLL